MSAHRTFARVGIAAVLAGIVGIPSLAAGGGPWKTDGVHVLDDIALSAFLADHMPGNPDIDDHGIDLGGIGSDLWHDPDQDGPGTYWMLTDRGPNGEDPRTFPVPEFTPFILKVRAANGSIDVLDAIPITDEDGEPVTGLANLVNTTPTPAALNEPIFRCNGVDSLAPNVNGLDAEGLVRARDGSFWVVEEYGPSLLKIASNGRVVKRWVPVGYLDYLPTAPSYPTEDGEGSIPEIFGRKRKLNRGFEGLAISPDQRTLYLALQSPLRNPNNSTGDGSRNTRILAFDVTTERVVAEYVYRFQLTGTGTNDDEFDVQGLPGTEGRARPQDMKVSGLAMLDANRMLVLERTDIKAKVFLVDLRSATNILGTSWDLVATSPSLETLNADGALETNGIVPLSKEPVATFDSTQGFPRKIEGLAVLDGRTLAIANDNDFGVGSFGGADCLLNDTGTESQLIVVRLEQSMKK